MPDILIRGMEMPENDSIIVAIRSDGKIEDVMGCYIGTAVELPPHGDLIDRDAFRAENEYYLNREFINPKYEDTLDDLLKNAPVIVPAERSGDGG